MIECDRQTFDRVWSGSGGPTVVPIAYENDQFSLCVEEASVDAIAGILHLDESERLSLRGRTEIESEWYLDDDGEQLTPDTLFAASPWYTADASQKLLCLTLDLSTAKAIYNTPSGYSGETFRWVRDQDHAA